MLEIVLYIGVDAIRDDTYAHISDSLPPVAKVSLFRSVAHLEDQLRCRDRSSMVLVAAPDGREDMLQLSNLHDLLNGVNLVVIMPKRIQSHTIDLAHGLYPRYLCFRPYCFFHLAVVIENICRSTESKHRITELGNQ